MSNRTRLPSTVAILTLATAAGSGLADPTTRPAATPYLGHFEYTYPGMKLRVEVNDDARLKWTIVDADGRPGRSAEQVVDRRLVAPGIYFTSWTEADGTIVAQVANYNTMRLTSTLVYRGRRSMLEGTIVRLPS